VIDALAKYNKDQLSLTNPRDALHYGERAANNKVDALCKKTCDRAKLKRFASKVVN